MEINFTVINEDNQKLQVDLDNQNMINNLINLLIEQNFIKKERKFIYSSRLTRKININLTFQEAKIMSGDLIYV